MPAFGRGCKTSLSVCASLNVGGVVYLEQIGHGGVTGRVPLQHVAGMLDRIEGIGAIGRRDVRHVRFVDRIEWVDVAGTLGRASDASGTVALCSFFE